MSTFKLTGERYFEYQVETRFNPEQCPAACHDWRPDGSPRPTLTQAAIFLNAVQNRASGDDALDYRLVRKECVVLDEVHETIQELMDKADQKHATQTMGE